MSIPILTTVYPGGTTTNYNVVFYTSNATPVHEAQRTTVGQYPTSNPNFSRAVQLTPEFLYVKRGSTTLGIPIEDLAGLAFGDQPTLSYSPLITLQPVSLSVKAGGGNTANFFVSANSESTLTYAWAANNGVGMLYNISNTSNNANGTYSLTNSTTLKITPISNTVNSYIILCVVSNATGNTNTGQVTLTVT